MCDDDVRQAERRFATPCVREIERAPPHHDRAKAGPRLAQELGSGRRDSYHLVLRAGRCELVLPGSHPREYFVDLVVRASNEAVQRHAHVRNDISHRESA
jgi:hypothetical protein